MDQLVLSPYGKIFYYEWKLDPSRSDYNIVFDQTFKYFLDIERLNKTIARFVADHLLLNSHLIEDQEEIFWAENDKIVGVVR